MKRTLAWVAAAASAAALAACSPTPHPAALSSLSSPTRAPAGAPTRWWSDANGAAGSVIDASHPTASAKGLTPNRDTYCGMLKQTLDAGHGVLSHLDTTTPAAVATVKAWLAELQAVAPSSVSTDWQMTAASITTILGSGGHSGKSLLPQGVTAQQLSLASQRISADAKVACHLTLAGSS